LLLVVSHLIAIPLQSQFWFYGVGLEKKRVNNLTWMREIFLHGQILSNSTTAMYIKFWMAKDTTKPNIGCLQGWMV
jgi:hypothetical protein